MSRSLFVTGEQIRAGRALARIEQSELARRCGVSLETIKRLERIRGPVDANVRTLDAILQAFGGLGIQFDSCEEGGVGVCMPPLNALGALRRNPGHARAEARAPHQIYRLIYCSFAATAAMEAMREILGKVIRAAAPGNRAKGVTGVLVASDGRFLQVLEGPKAAVQQTYGAISANPAHRRLEVIESRATGAARQFPDWSFAAAALPADCRMLRRQSGGQGGFRPEDLSPAGALDVLCATRDLQRANPSGAVTDSVNCPLLDQCDSRGCSFLADDQSA